ncbi:MAG: hypothetical protein AB7P49_03675 [Bdellovibrionales bacterium]
MDVGLQEIVKTLTDVITRQLGLNEVCTDAEASEFRAGKAAFNQIWPLFVKDDPEIDEICVRRGPSFGTAYIKVGGSTIVYSPTTTSIECSPQVENEKYDVVGLFILRDFLKDAKISLGDFVQLMLDAVEHPLDSSFTNLFNEYHLPRVHAHFDVYTVNETCEMVTIGKTTVVVDGVHEIETTATLVGPADSNPFITPYVLKQRHFWKALIRLIKERKATNLSNLDGTLPSSPKSTKRRRGSYEHEDEIDPLDEEEEDMSVVY